MHTPDPDDRLIVHATLARALRAAGQEAAAAHQAQLAASEQARMQAVWAQLGGELRAHGLSDLPDASVTPPTSAGARSDA